ncbi:MAG: TPM domain-containing protein [Amylibacter sp.]
MGLFNTWGIGNAQRNDGILILVSKGDREMRRLAEFEDDSYLAQGQQVEEALKSVDYDVWYCPYDDHTKIEGYKGWFSSYSACTKCNHITMYSTRTVLTSATTSRSDKARVEYTCKN